jgi:hypothetical protein
LVTAILMQIWNRPRIVTPTEKSYLTAELNQELAAKYGAAAPYSEIWKDYMRQKLSADQPPQIPHVIEQHSELQSTSVQGLLSVAM